MSQQNTKLKDSSSHLPITSTNENELMRRDTTDRDTGDLDDNITKQKPTKDGHIDIIQKGIDKSKDILTTIKNIFKL